MKNKKRKLNKQKYITFIIILILIIIYAIYTVCSLVIKPTDAFIVENGKLSLEETLQGYIIRDETVLKGENYKNGLIEIKAEGDKVAKGDAVLIVEAMKMEIPVVAPQDGTIASIDVAVGDPVEAGAVLATLN